VETVNNQEKHLMQIQEFVRAGIRPQIDLARRGRRLANAKVQRVAPRQLRRFAGPAQSAMGAGGHDLHAADGELPPVRGEDAPPAPWSTRRCARPELAAWSTSGKRRT